MSSLTASTVFVLLLLLPGFLFYYALVRKGAERKSSVTNEFLPARSLAFAFVVSSGFHVAWGLLWHGLFVPLLHAPPIPYALVLDLLFGLATDGPGAVSFRADPAGIATGLGYAAIYVVSQAVVGYYLGVVLEWFRYSVQTRYYARLKLRSAGRHVYARMEPALIRQAGFSVDQVLRDPVLKSAQFDGIFHPPDFVIVTVALPLGPRVVVYRGIVTEYEVSEEGQLDLVVLWGAFRRDLPRNERRDRTGPDFGAAAADGPDRSEPDGRDIVRNGSRRRQGSSDGWRAMHEYLILALNDHRPVAVDIDYVWLEMSQDADGEAGEEHADGPWWTRPPRTERC